MSEWLLRWHALPRSGQWLTVIAVPLVLLLLLAGWWLQPLRASGAALEQHYQQLQQRYEVRMAQLRSQPELSAQRQQNAVLLQSLQATEPQRFTLAALLQSGAALEKWQPTAQGGELTLLLNWPQFQHAMAWLTSRQPPVVINALLLQRSGEPLRMTLQLGLTDDE